MGTLISEPTTYADGSSNAAEAPPIWIKIDWFICVLLILVALFTSGLHIRAYPTLSPIDEIQHIDYALRASHFDFPREGERIEQEAMAEAACRSVDAPGYVSQPCGLPEYSPGDFQEQGYNTAASQLPLYYIFSGALARVIHFVTPIDSVVSSVRLTGGIWLGLAFCILWYAMATLGLRRRWRALAILWTSSTPLIVFFHSTTTPDASLYLLGSLLLLTFLKYEEGRLRWWWLFLILSLTFTVDRAIALPILVGGLFLAMRSLGPKKFEIGKIVVLMGIPVLMYFAYFRIFPFIQNHLQPKFGSTADYPMSSAHFTDDVSIDRMLQQVETVASPVHAVYLPYTVNTDIMRVFVSLLNWMILGSLAGLTFLKKSGSRLSVISGSTFLVMILAGPAYTFYYAYFSAANFSAPGRFGMSLMPFATLAIAAVLEKRLVMISTLIVAIASYGYLVWLLI